MIFLSILIFQMNEQEIFWKDTYADKYIKKNSQFNIDKGVIAWKKMLNKCQNRKFNILECGSNIGRNIKQIKKIHPDSKCSIIEINNRALEICKANNTIENAYHGSILDCDFEENQFDIVFTMGVLIHIAPNDLLRNISKMVKLSRKYVLIGEYFDRNPSTLDYQGEKNKLFKRDFGKYFLENFEGKCIDYGFLWSEEFESAGFDDITWWLFDINSMN